ncbi:MAG TPA: flagellar basal-body rod protein FlgG [Calditrichia bacterium]|nr:flagellar basal-body rod protein FlgG [Calditrichota bacterium]HQU72997.1 flagellar basal-body rod protein FlgG [Calditrichia bacterium]HQV30981.1 flagellar basal-body rod protein FlgG [Calditrichia bacterium]
MFRALKTSALGMTAQQMNVDNISNNLANVNTTGYKKSTVEFQDLLYENIQAGGAGGSRDYQKPTEIQIGLGNKPISTFRSFSQGSIVQTGNPLDIAINGAGFLQVLKPDGTIVYTRDGALKVNQDGVLVNNSGLRIYPDITIPENAQQLSIGQDGTVTVQFAGETNSTEIGQLEIVSFMNPAGLRALGGNLYEVTDASGDPSLGTPGENNMGMLAQGYLEKSNVDVAQEMIDLIVTQRAFEVNTKAVRTADELLSMVNNLKR